MFRKLRERVYQANMELFRRNLIVYTWGNVSEVDRERGVMAIKPQRGPYEELTAEMIVVQSLEDGAVLTRATAPPRTRRRTWRSTARLRASAG